MPATDEAALLRMISERTDGTPPPQPALFDRAQALSFAQRVDQVFLPEPVALLIARLIARAAPSDPRAPELVKSAVRYGPSPRAAIWLARLARSLAAIDGRSGAGFEDVAEAAPFVLGHRLILSYGARLDGVKPDELARQLYRDAERDLLGAEPTVRAAKAANERA